jgi:hypothetical protein
MQSTIARSLERRGRFDQYFVEITDNTIVPTLVKGTARLLAVREYSGKRARKERLGARAPSCYRHLTEREMLRLQGFPETFSTGESYSASHCLAGNSVTVPVVRAIAERVLEVLRNAPEGALDDTLAPAPAHRRGRRRGRKRKRGEFASTSSVSSSSRSSSSSSSSPSVSASAPSPRSPPSSPTRTDDERKTRALARLRKRLARVAAERRGDRRESKRPKK